MVVYAVGENGRVSFDEGFGLESTTSHEEIIDLWLRNEHGLWLGARLDYWLFKALLWGLSLERLYEHVVINKKSGESYSDHFRDKSVDFVSVSPEELGMIPVPWSIDSDYRVESMIGGINEIEIIGRLEFLYDEHLPLVDIRYDRKQLIGIEFGLWR